MSDQSVSWEDRVVALELEAKKEREKREALQAQVAERDATITSLKALVEESNTREKARRKAEIDGYVGSLKAKAGEKGFAIAEEKLKHVAQLFEAGLDEVAKSFGDTLVANATSTAGGGEVLDLGAKDQQAAADEVIADNLRAAGWKVEQDAKGRIVSKTPPQKAGR